MDRGSSVGPNAVTGDAGDAEWGFNDDDDEVVDGAGVADTRFESLVMGGGSTSETSPRRSKPLPLSNPLAEAGQAKASGWEWDEPTFGNGSSSTRVGATKSSLVSVEADSATTQSDDDFGSFGSYLSAPRPTTGNTTPLSSRLRTTTTTTTTTTSKLGGATKLGSSSGVAASGVLLPLPPPPSSSSLRATSPPIRQANYSVNGAFGNMHVSSSPRTMAPAPMMAPLNPSLSPPLAASSSSTSAAQKHAGGKASNLGDFDPFA
ncbi:hypothetical protein GGI21_006389 [Coemansia aciculifera]|nr:hypothetical protein GGI21_006389 [Coemansia aciculifera]